MEAHAGWGAAVWSGDEGGLGVGAAFATARGYLGNGSSNNMTEYTRLLECLSRALSVRGPNVLFEVDSMLLAKQLARRQPWACRSENLIPVHRQCVSICDALTLLHILWDIRHKNREFLSDGRCAVESSNR